MCSLEVSYLNEHNKSLSLSTVSKCLGQLCSHKIRDGFLHLPVSYQVELSIASNKKRTSEEVLFNAPIEALLFGTTVPL